MNGLTKREYPTWVQFVLALLKGWLYIYDWLAYLPFKFFASPSRKLLNSNRIKARQLDENDPSSPYRSVDCLHGKLCNEEFPGFSTLDALFERAVRLYGDSDCLGTREIISVDREKQSNGIVFEKLNMGEYVWMTYDDLDGQTLEIGSGLLRLNHRVGEKVVIFAETRAEWMITALACFRYNLPVVSIYATLGQEGIVHAVNETEAVTIFASHDLVEKTFAILSRCKSLRRLIYFESRLPDAEPLDETKLTGLPEGFRVLGFNDLSELGDEELRRPEQRPTPDDMAIIMYTSGTTGTPKGVVMTHRNLVCGNAGQCAYVPNLAPPAIYIGYLPLAHVLELTAEFGSLSHGVRVGYSSPLTLTDNSSKIKTGAKGDITVLQPTFMATVPIILDRIYKTVIDKVEHSSPFSRALFEFLYELKRSKIETGYDTPFLNRLIFRKIRAVLGGRVRLILSGGAPLNDETQRFMTICFCCPVGQGYGLTETCGAGCVCEADDLKCNGRVGPPLQCNDVRLLDWDEAGYKVTNKPYPQGEVLVSGDNVTVGYYNNPAKTAEDMIEIDGRQWFRSGDIGEFYPDGTLKIIDRKKDLVKLQHGEYVSLSKVESVLLTHPLVDNICMYGDPLTSYAIALVVPNEKNVKILAKKINVVSDDLEELRTNKEVVAAVLRELQAHSKSNRLEKFERPEKIYLCKEIWTVDSGLLTDAMKLKRKPLEAFYRDIIQKLYATD